MTVEPRPLSEVLMEAAGLGEDVDDDVVVGETFDAQQVGETRFCKRISCTGEAADRRGRYAGLCDPHKREQITSDKETGVLQAPGTTAVPRAPKPVAASPGGDVVEVRVDLVELVKGLEKPARRFQRALNAKRATKEEATASLAEFKTALGDLRNAAQTLIEEAQ